MGNTISLSWKNGTIGAILFNISLILKILAHSANHTQMLVRPFRPVRAVPHMPLACKAFFADFLSAKNHTNRESLSWKNGHNVPMFSRYACLQGHFAHFERSLSWKNEHITNPYLEKMGRLTALIFKHLPVRPPRPFLQIPYLQKMGISRFLILKKWAV